MWHLDELSTWWKHSRQSIWSGASETAPALGGAIPSPTFPGSPILGRVMWLIWPVWYKQQWPCVFWAWTFKTYWVTLSVNLSCHQWLSQSHILRWRWDKIKNAWLIGSTNAFANCLTSGGTLLYKALRFWISYHSKTCSNLSMAPPLSVSAYRFLPFRLKPWTSHCTQVGHVMSCLGLWEDIVPLVPLLPPTNSQMVSIQKHEHYFQFDQYVTSSQGLAFT